MKINEDYSNQEIGLQGYYKTCNFTNSTIKGEIRAVLKDCTFDNVTFDEVVIIELRTPGTKINNLTINKRSIQPIHWAKCKLWKEHNHEYNAGLLRKRAESLPRGETKTAILTAADFIEANPRLSWSDFLYHPKTPKIVWDEFTEYYKDDSEQLKRVEEVIKKRW